MRKRLFLILLSYYYARYRLLKFDSVLVAKRVPYLFLIKETLSLKLILRTSSFANKR